MEGSGKTGGPAGPGPPPDSDLVGIPLVIGIFVGVAAVIAAFWLIGGLAGVIVLAVVLVIAVWLSFRVIASSDVAD